MATTLRGGVGMGIVGAIAMLGLVLLALPSGPAHAAFPGHNGRIAFGSERS